MPWRPSRSLWRFSRGQKSLPTRAYSLRETPASFDLRFHCRAIHASSRCYDRVTSAQLEAGTRGKDPAEELRVQGLVRSIRKQKRIAFASVADGTTLNTLHAVLTPGLAKHITNGSYVDLMGRWVKSPGKGQSHDLQVEYVNELGSSDAEENPVQKKVTSSEFLRSIPHLRVRGQLPSLLTRARGQMIRAVADYFEEASEEPAVQVHPPVITSSDCEGAGEVFTITPATPTVKSTGPESPNEHFFGEPKYLTVSNQLHLEAWSAELGNVWALAPTFRAEASETPRHLAEFYMLEAEFRGTSSLDDVISQAEKLIRHVTRHLSRHRTGRDLLAYYNNNNNQITRPLSDNEADISLAERWTAILFPEPWPRITYTDAIKTLEAAHDRQPDIFEHKPSWDDGLALEHEKWLVQSVARQTPLVVTDYPAKHKPFYMLPNSALLARNSSEVDPQSSETAACFDILLPFGYAEVCGGSLREHRLKDLIAAIRSRGMLRPRSPQPSSTKPDVDGGDTAASGAPNPANTPEIQTEFSSMSTTTSSAYPYLEPNESLGALQWYADLRRFGSSPHGGFGIGFDRLMAYLVGVHNIRDMVGFPRGHRHCHC